MWLGCVFFNRKEKVLEKLKTGLKKAKRAVSVVGGKLGQSQGSKAKSVASRLDGARCTDP